MDGNSQAHRILFVEDDADTLYVTSRLLERRGYRVVTATDVASGVECARRQRVDLMIADIGLPDGTGIELLEQVRAMYAIPCIVVSGYETPDQPHPWCSRYLTKPLIASKLFTAIEETIAVWRLATLDPAGRSFDY